MGLESGYHRTETPSFTRSAAVKGAGPALAVRPSGPVPMQDPLLMWLTGGVFVLVFALVLFDFLRTRDLPRLEVAALLGGLALVFVLQAAGEVAGFEPPRWAAAVAVLA